MNKEIVIDMEKIDVDWRDCGPWRSFELSTYGTSMEECLERAVIGEVDQDGGEIDCYGFDNASNEVQKAIEEMIKNEFKKIETSQEKV